MCSIICQYFPLLFPPFTCLSFLRFPRFDLMPPSPASFHPELPWTSVVHNCIASNHFAFFVSPHVLSLSAVSPMPRSLECFGSQTRGGAKAIQLQSDNYAILVMCIRSRFHYRIPKWIKKNRIEIQKETENSKGLTERAEKKLLVISDALNLLCLLFLLKSAPEVA